MNKHEKKILIIEDEDALRSILADALRHSGFVVIEAKDGHAGIMSAESAHPDLILLDILMPRMDGRAVFKAFRENEKTRAIPVLFLTNLSTVESISGALDGEKADYIIKSDWSIDEIIARVKKKLA